MIEYKVESWAYGTCHYTQLTNLNIQQKLQDTGVLK